MFSNSSQRRYWLYSSGQEVNRQRTDSNAKFCHKHSEAAARQGCQFAVPLEEAMLCQYYMKKLFGFCNQFQPPIPRSALGTAAAYYKRFYMQCSVMEHHPKDIFLCCVYLALKVEEYNVSIDQFVHILAAELRQPVATLVLEHELLMLRKLKFHLTVHSPFRPMEGFIIDMKTRRSDVPDPDGLRTGADTFLLKSLYSDAGLLYPPSQIALAALYHSARNKNVDITQYIKMVLLQSDTSSGDLLRTLQNIEDLVNAVMIPESSREVEPIMKKLESCKELLSSQPSRKRKSDGPAAGDHSDKRPRDADNALIGITRLT